MDIEYAEVFDDLQAESTFRGQQWFGKRKLLVDKYSWAVPNEEVITYLAEFDHIYEGGAGSGYWADLIERAGGSVTAFDIDPPDDTWITVEENNILNMRSEFENEPLLLVWPPMDTTFCKRIHSRPSHILYVGEKRGGCTGTDVLFDMLDERYGLVAHIELPSYAGVRDDFYHYVRKI